MPTSSTDHPTAPQSNPPPVSRILLAGPSASGKTTLAELLARRLNVPAFSIDSFFIRRKPIWKECGDGQVRTFERPELYDGPRMAAELSRLDSGWVAEGFCLFHYPEMLELAGDLFYVDLPFALCLERRLARKPHRPSDRSFALIGAGETASIVEPQKVLPGVITVDGVLPAEQIVEQILRAIGRHNAAAA